MGEACNDEVTKNCLKDSGRGVYTCIYYEAVPSCIGWIRVVDGSEGRRSRSTVYVFFSLMP